MFCHIFQLEFALERYLELKMSAQYVHMDSEASSQSSISGPEGPDFSHVSRKPKQRKNQCTAWHRIFNIPFKQIFLAGATTHEKTNLLTEHLQTRLVHRKPHAVHSVAVFCDFRSVLLPLTDVSPFIPVPMTRPERSISISNGTAEQRLETNLGPSRSTALLCSSHRCKAEEIL